MKSFFLMIMMSLTILSAAAQSNDKNPSIEKSSTLQIVEAACGQCKFGLKGKGCVLAVRIKNKSYFVEGAAIDEFGDAHATDGFCNKIRKATVEGSIVDNKFIATSFKLLPDTK